MAGQRQGTAIQHVDHAGVAQQQPVDAEASATLKAAVDYLKAHPDVKVALSGFVDSTGNADELPMGLMVWHAALHDDDVLNISAGIEAVLNPN